MVECIPVWLGLTLPVRLVNGMECSDRNITVKAFKLLMLTGLFLLLCSLVLLNGAFLRIRIQGGVTVLCKSERLFYVNK